MKTIYQKRTYEKPAMQVFDLRTRQLLLVGSGNPEYNPFNDEQDW